MHAAAAFANPSSPHAAGRRARALLEDARERILTLVGGRTSGAIRDQLVFTSGATEANRLGVLGTAGRHAGILGHGNDACMLPGQLEAAAAARSDRAGGLLFSTAEVAALNEIAHEAGLAALDPDALPTA